MKNRDQMRRGGGWGDMSIFEYSPQKWPKTHAKKLFLSIFELWQNRQKNKKGQKIPQEGGLGVKKHVRIILNYS